MSDLHGNIYSFLKYWAQFFLLMYAVVLFLLVLNMAVDQLTLSFGDESPSKTTVYLPITGLVSLIVDRISSRTKLRKASRNRTLCLKIRNCAKTYT